MFKFKIIFLLFVFAFVSCKSQYPNEYSGYQKYRSLDKALANKNNVKLLDLSNQELEVIPEGVFELIHLEVLILNNNKLEKIPRNIQSLQKLERLEIMKNQIDKLPLEIVELKNLKKINVAYNRVNEKDVEFIKEALPSCTIITEFIL